MPSVDTELFSLSGATPIGASGHGSATLSGTGSAAVEFRRGIDLSASIDIEGQLEGKVGTTLAASLKAGLDVRVGVIVQAQIPLDLFTEAGLIARAELDAAASAYAALTLSLSANELERQLKLQKLGLAGDLLDILLDEFVVSAGIWVKASFAAELMARGMLSASLLGDEPGFTFTFEAGAALAYGSGLSFLVNVGIDDPSRLMGRVADRLATTIVSLIGDSTAVEKEAAAVAKVLLPGLLRSCLQMGLQLRSATSGDTATANAGRALTANVLSRSVNVVLQSGVDAAFAALRQALAGSSILADLVNVRDTTAAYNAIEALRTSLGTLDVADPGDPSTWLPALLDTLANVDKLVTLDGIPADVGAAVTPPVAIIWAAGVLVDGVMAQATSGNPSQVSLLDGAPSQDPGPALRALYGGSVTYRTLATYLIDELDDLLAGVPELAEVLAFIGRLVGSNTAVVGTLLQLAGESPENATAGLLHLIEAEIGSALTNDLLPALIAATRNAPTDVQEFVNALGKPLITALAAILPSVLDDVADADGRTRAREGLSAIVMIILADSVMTIGQILMDHASANGAASAQQTAADIQRDGESSPAHQQLAAAGESSAVSPQTTASIVNQASTLMPNINHSGSSPLNGTITQGVTGGVGDPAASAQAAHTILATDSAPGGDVLGKAVGQAATQGVDFAGTLLAEILKEIGDAIAKLAATVVTAIEAAAVAVFHALEAGVAWAQETVAQLEQRIAQLEQAAAAYLAQVLGAAAQLADALRTSADAFFDYLIDQVTDWLNQNLPGFISSWVVPIVRSVLKGLEELADELLTTAASVASALSARLRAAAGAGQLTPQMFDDHVNAVVYGAPDNDVHLSIAGPLGSIPVSVPAGMIAGASLSTLQNHPAYPGSRSTAVGGVAAYASAQSNRSQAVAAKNSAQVAANMGAQVDGMRTGQPLAVKIESPATGGVEPSLTTAAIRLSGANRSFVEPQISFGMPNRVRIFLNDQEITTTPNQWAADGDDLMWKATLLALVPAVVPTPVAARENAREVIVPVPRRRAMTADAAIHVVVSTSRRPRTQTLDAQPPSVAVPSPVPRARVPLATAGAVFPAVLAAHPGANTLVVAVADGGGQQAQDQIVFSLQSPLDADTPVRIATVVATSPVGEYVTLRNTGSSTMSLAGWTIRDVARHVLRLPGVDVAPGAEIQVHTTSGTDSASAIYLNRKREVWNNTGDTALLIDPAGELVDTFTYVGKA